LAAAALADEPQAFAAVDVQADAVDRDYPEAAAGAEQPPGAQAEALTDVGAFDQRRGGVGRPWRPLAHQMRRVAWRDLADRLQALAGLHVEARHCPQQGAQIGMAGAAEDVVEGAALHD